MSWLIRILLSCVGLVAAWFVSRNDEPRYTIMEFVVVLLLLLAAAVVTLYFPAICDFVRRLLPKRDPARTKRPTR